MDRNCFESRKGKLPALLDFTHRKCVKAYGESFEEPFEGGVHPNDYALARGWVTREAIQGTCGQRIMVSMDYAT